MSRCVQVSIGQFLSIGGLGIFKISPIFKVKYRNCSIGSKVRFCTVPKIISVSAGAVGPEYLLYIGILCTHTGSGTRYTVHRCICSNGCRLCFNAIFRLILGQCGNCEKEDSVLKCMKLVMR